MLIVLHHHRVHLLHLGNAECGARGPVVEKGTGKVLFMAVVMGHAPLEQSVFPVFPHIPQPAVVGTYKGKQPVAAQLFDATLIRGQVHLTALVYGLEHTTPVRLHKLTIVSVFPPAQHALKTTLQLVPAHVTRHGQHP